MRDRLELYAEQLPTLRRIDLSRNEPLRKGMRDHRTLPGAYVSVHRRP